MRFSGLSAAALTLALAVPGPAYPYDLPQLLSMPLERLLQLKITTRGAAMLAAHRASRSGDGATYRSEHAP